MWWNLNFFSSARLRFSTKFWLSSTFAPRRTLSARLSWTRIFCSKVSLLYTPKSKQIFLSKLSYQGSNPFSAENRYSEAPSAEIALASLIVALMSSEDGHRAEVERIETLIKPLRTIDTVSSACHAHIDRFLALIRLPLNWSLTKIVIGFYCKSRPTPSINQVPLQLKERPRVRGGCKQRRVDLLINQALRLAVEGGLWRQGLVWLADMPLPRQPSKDSQFVDYEQLLRL